MKFNIFIFFTLNFILLSCTNQQNDNAETTSLFNQQDLSGWHVDVPAMDDNMEVSNPFIVRNNMLVSLGEPSGHLITDADYEDYRLEIEYRYVDEPGNSGVLVHASTLRAQYDMFPQSIEVQLKHGEAGDFYCFGENITVPNMVQRRGPKEEWGVTEGKAQRIKKLIDDAEKPVGKWNSLTIECLVDEVKVWINNRMVNYGYNCTAYKGKIALQSEGAELEFRKIDITPITKKTSRH